MANWSAKSKVLISFPSKLWLHRTKKYPYLQFTIKAFVPISHDPFVGNSLVSIQGTNPETFISELDDHPSLISYSIMEKKKNLIIINTHTKDPFLLRAIVKNMILVNLPVLVSNGIAEFNISSSRRNIDNFIKDLELHGLKVELKRLGNYSENLIEQILTPRQFEIYLHVKDKGYYDTPRQITLSELANELHLAKSSLSSMLQRIHSKLLGN
ncbi:MAG: helix-turn-helix domain-containing protein [Candidatus Lokiarchaeota archaeon]|nr:helix-turn-helix domain-containing protein [Candidatus Harpocratesius repetitus]